MSGEINEKTRVGLFAVIYVLPVLASLVFFIAMIYFKADAAEAGMQRQGSEIHRQRELLMELVAGQARIEARLEALKNK